ncbi:transcriptional regulator [Brevibacillus borstelensis AK1]|jgi:AcrR family transcriptional regulator|uniref:Transcriptional regulator n=3 Tax=Brevibacillus TaxID=55080 RepID=M8D1W0_9BACL|nr:transcriptional regulator [Brevibacillus borstelensis AK1]
MGAADVQQKEKAVKMSAGIALPRLLAACQYADTACSIGWFLRFPNFPFTIDTDISPTYNQDRKTGRSSKKVGAYLMTRSPRAQAKAEAKRAHLIEQATRCLAEKGYASVSLRDIARESGVSLGILHYYFASKEDLLLSVISGYKERFLQELEEDLILGPVTGWQTRLSSLLRKVMTEDRNLHRLWYDLQVQAMYVDAFRQPVREIRERLYTLISRMLEKLLSEKGQNTPPPSQEWVHLLYTALDGMFFQALLMEPEQADRMIAKLDSDLSRLLAMLFDSHKTR